LDNILFTTKANSLYAIDIPIPLFGISSYEITYPFATIVLKERMRVLLYLVGVYTDILVGKISYKRTGRTAVISKNNGFIIDNEMASKTETNRMGAFLLDPNGKSAPIKFEILKNGNLKYQIEQVEGVRTKDHKNRRSLRLPAMLTLVKI